MKPLLVSGALLAGLALAFGGPGVPEATSECLLRAPRELSVQDIVDEVLQDPSWNSWSPLLREEGELDHAMLQLLGQESCEAALLPWI